MLVTTFSGDIQQFRMFCHCLNKNWEGQRKLIVCLGNGDNIELFTNITKEFFNADWQIDIKPTIHSYKSGETEQQVNAVYYSIHSGADDVIIWDCKDFILRPCNYGTFKKHDKYRVTYLLHGQKLVNMGYNLDGLVDQPIDRYTAISNIRPWMWNVQQLTRYWNRLNERFGDYRTWKLYPAGNEIYGYHICALQDPDRLVEYLTHKEMPLLFGGGWTHQTYDGILKEATDFDQNTERIVWKHSRKLEDPRCIDVTRSVLIKYGIDKSFVDQVYS